MAQGKEIPAINEYRCLLSWVKASVNGEEPPKSPGAVDFSLLFALAKDNSFAQAVYPCIKALKGRGELPEPVFQKFVAEYQVALAQDLNQQFELQTLLAFCEEQKIECIPLKGGVLKNLYSESYMRYMGDIDLWVQKDGFEKLSDFLCADGYRLKEKSGIHDEYIKPPYIALELHRDLVLSDNKAAAFFNEEMVGRAEPYKDYRFVKTLTPEDQYVYLIDHTAKHFYESGITARMVLDFYIFNRAYRKTLNEKKLSQMLTALRYTVFERRLRALSYDWFAPGGSGLSKDDRLSLYIVQNGSFGRSKNLYVSRSVRESKDDQPPSKLKYVLRRLFPNKQMLQKKFPALKKKPWLFPLMVFPWWVTWFDTLFIKKNLDYKTLKHVNDIKGESAQSMRSLYEEMDLDYRK